jgi:hypothetical protein
MSDQAIIDPHAAKSIDVRDVVRHAFEEFVRAENQKVEPAYKAELEDERRRREALELRLNQLVEENRKTKAQAEEADKNSQIRTELQKLGVVKVELAFRAVKDEIVRGDDGRLQPRASEHGSLQAYLAGFVQENPELLPARIAGGSGAQASTKVNGPGLPPIELATIRPGMNKEDLDQVRKEISRLATQALRGQ